MREDLIGYLLGAADAPVQDEVERRLSHDENLRADLQKVRHCLLPLGWGRREYQPPAGLAQRACARVADHVQGARVELGAKGYLPAELAGALSARRWSLADLLVAAGVCLAAALLFLPAIANGRYQAQLARCQNNLRQLGIALVQYSDRHGGRFPAVAASGQLAAAGVYAPILKDEGYVAQPNLFLCPSSPLAQDADSFHVPTLRELQDAGPSVARLHETMGGSYGYNIGFVEGDQLQAVPNRGRDYYALMSDTPDAQAPDYRSQNHGSCGQNVLFESGRVRHLSTCRALGCSGDEIFVNDHGLVQAGVHVDDAVIGHSAAPPLITPVNFRPR